MRWRGFVGRAICLVVVGAVLCSCDHREHNGALEASEARTRPRLPEDDAGRVLQRAINVAGGWETWRRMRDVSFVSTLTIFDSRGDATSETIFFHKQLLHRGPLLRMESIGLKEEVVFGYDGRESWMLQGGRWVEEPQRKVFTEFHGISSALSFGLPFVLGETEGVHVHYAGDEANDMGRWEKLRVTYDPSLRSPIPWAVLYFDADSGLLHRVHARVDAPFLSHAMWLGRWREYRAIGGIQQERVRSFYPADENGVPIGGLTAEQLIEHVQFNVGHSRALFLRPPRAGEHSWAAVWTVLEAGSLAQQAHWVGPGF